MAGIVTSGSMITNKVAHTGSLNNKWVSDILKPYFDKWIVKEIRFLLERQPLFAFVVMSCAIDYLSSFMAGGRTNGGIYKKFIVDYFPGEKYNSIDIYHCLRCGLVHMFTINDRKYVLTSGRSDLHLTVNENSQKILNAENFYEDLLFAANNFFDKAEKDPDLLQKCIDRYENFGVFEYKEMTIVI